MRTGEAMFRVLVLGGLALTSQEACGSTGSPPVDAGSDAQNADAFPSELPAYVDANVGFGDAATDATTTNDGSTADATSQDGFPQEGPPPPPPP